MYTRTLVLLFGAPLLFNSTSAHSQETSTAEICDNGLDDDGDGLYDAYDPDCICEAATEPLAYINNGDFELTNGCCNGMDSTAAVCLEDWFLVTLSPDYISPACAETDFALFDQIGVQYTGGFIGMGPSVDTDGFVKTESMGVCLESEFKSCRTYTITFNSLIINDLDFGSPQTDLEYVIYGLPDCPVDGDFDFGQSFCNNPIADQAQEIMSFNVMDNDRDEWIRHVSSFVPIFDINAIVIYVRCGQQTNISGTPFLYFDNFEFLIGPVDCSISGQVEVSGDPCINDYTLTADVVNGETYQWFKDSIPILGATEVTYQPQGNDISGRYTALVSNNVECAFIDGGQITMTEDMSVQVFDTICTTDYIIFDADTLREAGTYSRSFTSGSGGCGDTETLNLYVIPNLASDVDINPGLNAVVGSDVIFTPTDAFLDQITGYRWMENGMALNQSDATLTTSSAAAGSVSYSFEFTHSQGCMQTTTFTIEWSLPIATDEDCTNNIDDDLDGLIDTFDDDCTCMISQMDIVELSGQICQGDSYVFGNRSLFDEGTYMDTFVNTINCDSIMMLTLTVVPEQRDTLYETILEGEQFDFFGATYTEQGWYTYIEVDNTSDCDSIYTLRLEVDYPLAIYVPNVISLGSASGNDQFYISPNKPITLSDISIYNRWGNAVFKQERVELVGDDPAIWDGTINGRPVAQGVYIYSFSYTDGDITEQVIGDLTIIN